MWKWNALKLAKSSSSSTNPSYRSVPSDESIIDNERLSASSRDDTTISITATETDAFVDKREYSEDLDVEEAEEVDVVHSKSTGRRPSKLSIISFLVVLVSTLVNLILTLSSTSKSNFISSLISSPPTPDTSTTYKLPLRRPSQFIGLERVNYTLHPFPQMSLKTFPSALLQLDKAHPQRIMTDVNVDPEGSWSYFGSVSGEGRGLLASNEIQTVVQFRIRDWGFERCTLTLTLPHTSLSTTESPASIASPLPPTPLSSVRNSTNPRAKGRHWSLKGTPTDLELWVLTNGTYTQTWFDPSRLSYASLPPLKKNWHHLFSMNLLAASSGKKEVFRTSEFECSSDEILTVLVFCVSPRCELGIWQDRMKPAFGLWLEQKTSH